MRTFDAVVLIVGVVALIVAGVSVVYQQNLLSEIQSLQNQNESLEQTLAQLANLTGYGDLFARSEIIRNAMEEGRIVVYSGASLTASRAQMEGFKKKYPWIEVDLWGVAAEARVAEKVESEIAAGALAADVVGGIGGVEKWYRWKDEGWLQSYHSPEDISYDPQFYDSEGYWRAESTILGCMAWNTEYVSEEDAPTTWADVLDHPEWAGKIGMVNPYAVGGSITIWAHILMNVLPSPPYGPAFFEGLMDMDVKLYLSHGTMKAALESGEIWVSVQQLWHYVAGSIEAGAPIDFVMPSDGTYASPQSVLMFKDAPHPNCAILWVDYVMSYEGQTAVTAIGHWSVRTEGPSYGPLQPALSDITVAPTDFSEFLDQYDATHDTLGDLGFGE